MLLFIRVSFSVLAILFSTHAAAINRCNVGGQFVYQDRPCDGDPKPAKAAKGPASATQSVLSPEQLLQRLREDEAKQSPAEIDARHAALRKTALAIVVRKASVSADAEILNSSVYTNVAKDDVFPPGFPGPVAIDVVCGQVKLTEKPFVPRSSVKGAPPGKPIPSKNPPVVQGFLWTSNFGLIQAGGADKVKSDEAEAKVSLVCASMASKLKLKHVSSSH